MNDDRVGDDRVGDDLTSTLRIHTDELLSDPAIPGTVAVMVRGRDRAVLASGRRRRGEPERVRAGTPFALGSITKAFTALLLAEMAARGDVGLRDPIEAHLPPPAAPRGRPDPPITLLDLATHSGGLPRFPLNMVRRGLPRWISNPYARYRVEDLHRATARLRPRRRAVRYSTFGVGLLGTLLAGAAGTDYGTLVRQRVLAPLALHGTGIPGTGTLAAPPATGHRRGRPVPHWTLDALAGAGALYSTGDDLLRFLLAQLHPDTTPLADAIRASQLPRVRYRRSDNDVCLVWNHRVVDTHPLFWHTGGTGGFTAYIGFAPSLGAGAAVLANSVPTRKNPVLRAGRRLLRRAAFPDR
ncbi:serine hydrolase domain-containing protein [Streptomyces sp. SBT349]|uniref:serine hydrolase domain-containing protein n=1 Tax=Streptomyces sp. SBT349 TaxID=1580539 RepID=UPI00069F3F30|nr:serine hydrolase domain-containing protein [Streptomyces sp. SBT349]